jgi:hypothetical protein
LILLPCVVCVRVRVWCVCVSRVSCKDQAAPTTATPAAAASATTTTATTAFRRPEEVYFPSVRLFSDIDHVRADIIRHDTKPFLKALGSARPPPRYVKHACVIPDISFLSTPARRARHGRPEARARASRAAAMERQGPGRLPDQAAAVLHPGRLVHTTTNWQLLEPGVYYLGV